MLEEIIQEEEKLYYDHLEKKLKGDVVKYANYFVEHDCLQYVRGLGLFGTKYSYICLPLNEEEKTWFKGIEFTKKPFNRYYNNTPYVLHKITEGELKNTWECSCQGWQTRKKQSNIIPLMANCKHTLALFKYFKHKNY